LTANPPRDRFDPSSRRHARLIVSSACAAVWTSDPFAGHRQISSLLLESALTYFYVIAIASSMNSSRASVLTSTNVAAGGLDAK
jgi:hypothetical protein